MGPFALRKWQALFMDWKVFGGGFLTTIGVSIIALTLALIIGSILGIWSTSENKGLSGMSRVYVEVIQNTPLVIQIFFWFNGLPYLGIVLPVFAIGCLGLAIYQGAYVAEVIKSGIRSIPKGQLEAAYSQGFTYWEAMRYIIIPQAIHIILPPLTNVAVNLIKNTSALAIISGGDLMYHADSWSSNNLYWGPTYIVTGILYFMLCYPLTHLAKKLEIKANQGQGASISKVKNKKVNSKKVQEGVA